MDDGKSAFPLVVDDMSKNQVVEAGISMRDYFAAVALGAMTHLHPTYASGPDNKTAAERAYAIADAMLMVRSK